ncbi:class I SAM-dependent methyltransferase [Aestuariimicrobium ganziense]|uniref:class I SAM-dependent methyltransferase n=1 Tax=Aestuariimicrobium ganziense TaxID=2773677 RepID=UPI00194540DF|nr:methyltransferase [Aestuariimicrobium ganziense]
MSHYFTTPDGDERRREVGATIWGREHTFTTANGVFSGTRLDPGTAVLFRETAPPEPGLRLADVGCGFGPIAVALAVHSPGSQVAAVDVNDRALQLTAVNAHAAGVGDRVHILRPEQVDPQARYDEIWSNPPIRIGKEALHALLLEWLPRLSADGRMVMVVGKFLGADSLQRWLTDQGWACRRLGSAKGFRVLEVTRIAHDT